MTLTELRKKPTLMEFVKKTDTSEILKKAIKLAEEHTHYLVGDEPRFTNYYTAAEAKTGITGRVRLDSTKPVFARVKVRTVFEQYRFKAALEIVRKKQL